MTDVGLSRLFQNCFSHATDYTFSGRGPSNR